MWRFVAHLIVCILAFCPPFAVVVRGRRRLGPAPSHDVMHLSLARCLAGAEYPRRPRRSQLGWHRRRMHCLAWRVAFADPYSPLRIGADALLCDTCASNVAPAKVAFVAEYPPRGGTLPVDIMQKHRSQIDDSPVEWAAHPSLATNGGFHESCTSRNCIPRHRPICRLRRLPIGDSVHVQAFIWRQDAVRLLLSSGVRTPCPAKLRR